MNYSSSEYGMGFVLRPIVHKVSCLFYGSLNISYQRYLSRLTRVSFIFIRRAKKKKKELLKREAMTHPNNSLSIRGMKKVTFCYYDIFLYYITYMMYGMMNESIRLFYISVTLILNR